MANRIQIRHGSSTPTTTNLLPYELGWDGDSLYINNGKSTQSVVCIGGTGFSIAANKITGTLSVAHGGTGLTTSTNVNAIITGNSTTATSAFTTIRTNNGALYATSQDGAATFGTLPVAQGGTGTTSFTANSLIISGSTTTSALTTRAITNNSSATAAATGTNIPTMNTLYYALPKFNNSKSYTSNSTFYMPTDAGTANQILVSAGGTSAPTWKATASGAAYATSANGALTFGTLPVAQGGTGQTSIANIKAGKDADGNTISSTYLKLSGGTLTGALSGTSLTMSGQITGNSYYIGSNKLNLTDLGELVTVSSGNTQTYTLENSTRHVFFVIGAAASNQCILLVGVTSGGTVTDTKLGSASNITITTGTNSYKIKSASYEAKIIHLQLV